jgi:release factor glutamine methyltransferase
MSEPAAVTVAQSLSAAMAQGLERLDAQLLLLHALDKPSSARAWLLAHDTDPLTQAQQQQLVQLLQRRMSGEPLAYITGEKEFFGLPLRVDARVLVPRPDTETLVEWALELLPPVQASACVTADADQAIHVLDLGTGSGAIALAIRHSRPDVTVLAVDFSADALAVARDNAQRLKLPVEFVQGSWLSEVAGRFDLIVSNPPYIRDQDPHLPSLVHEPLQALTAGADGLDDLRLIIQQSPSRLLPGAWLLLEHGYDQAATVRQLLIDAGFTDVQSRRDLAGIERSSGGRRASQA